MRKFEISGADWSKPQVTITFAFPPSFPLADMITKQLLNTAYQSVNQCLSDPSLPVRVQAALTLPELCEHPQVHEGVAPHIGQIMKGEDQSAVTLFDPPRR